MKSMLSMSKYVDDANATSTQKLWCDVFNKCFLPKFLFQTFNFSQDKKVVFSIENFRAPLFDVIVGGRV